MGGFWAGILQVPATWVYRFYLHFQVGPAVAILPFTWVFYHLPATHSRSAAPAADTVQCISARFWVPLPAVTCNYVTVHALHLPNLVTCDSATVPFVTPAAEPAIGSGYATPACLFGTVTVIPPAVLALPLPPFYLPFAFCKRFTDACLTLGVHSAPLPLRSTAVTCRYRYLPAYLPAILPGYVHTCHHRSLPACIYSAIIPIHSRFVCSRWNSTYILHSTISESLHSGHSGGVHSGGIPQISLHLFWEEFQIVLFWRVGGRTFWSTIFIHSVSTT